MSVSGPPAEPPPPHRRFAEHFTDAMYDGSGSAGDVLPFGTDDGADEIFAWPSYGPVSDAAKTVAFTLSNGEAGGPLPDLADLIDDSEYGDQVMVAAFVLPYCTGQIDDDGAQLVLRLLRQREHDMSASSSDAVMLRDLETFTGVSPEQRSPSTPPQLWFGISYGQPRESRARVMSRYVRRLNTSAAWWHWWEPAGIAGLEVVPRMDWNVLFDTTSLDSDDGGPCELLSVLGSTQDFRRLWREAMRLKQHSAIDRHLASEEGLTVAVDTVNMLLAETARHLGLQSTPEVLSYPT